MILYKYNPYTSSTRFKSKIFLFSSKKQKLFGVLKKIRNTGHQIKKNKLLNKRIPPRLKKHINVNSVLFFTKCYGVLLSFTFYCRDKVLKGIVKFTNGSYCYINCVSGLLPGNIIKSTILPPFYNGLYNLGDTIMLAWVQTRVVFINAHFIGNRVMYGCAAGTFCIFLKNEEIKSYSKIKLPSGITKYIYSFSFITLGRNSNFLVKKIIKGKAGDNIIRGYKSSVRGVSMNPVDHPHGGRTKTNSPEKTPWGKIAKKNK